MKKTFYGHFVAGENQDEIKLNVQNMMKHGVKPILDYSAEEDLEASKSTSAKTEPNIHHSNIYDPSEMQSDKNLKIFMDCIDVVESKSNDIHY
jgi:proline dehydrogenase